MYNQAFFIPRGYGFMPNANLLRNVSPLSRGSIGRLFTSIKNLNWSGIINNTSKTLGVINQTIPIVKQVGPMAKNMRSMLKVASLFKDETDSEIRIKNVRNNISNKSVSDTSSTKNNSDYSDYSPSFFVS